jgi:tetraacyldisaccharide 4'-kinase
VPLYAAGLALKNSLRTAGVLPIKKLQWPVVSVGSLSAGGAGKTPVVIALAELLKARGWHVDVLTRGYARTGTGVERVDPTAPDAPRRYGDEPALIARKTGVPVWVGANRFESGTIAERQPTSPSEQKSLHLLDDGFQHRQLARTLDIVLITEQDLHDVLLPAGNLREPLSSLRRADVVVLREPERASTEAGVRGLMRPDALLWTVRRELRLPNAINPGPKPLAFCAIARPDGFWAMLAQADCEFVDQVAFPDHQPYDMVDLDRLVAIATERRATGFLTTEKDAVKLSGLMLQRLQSIGPVCVAALAATFTDESEVVRELEARCR